MTTLWEFIDAERSRYGLCLLMLSRETDRNHAAALVNQRADEFNQAFAALSDDDIRQMAHDLLLVPIKDDLRVRVSFALQHQLYDIDQALEAKLRTFAPRQNLR